MLLIKCDVYRVYDIIFMNLREDNGIFHIKAFPRLWFVRVHCQHSEDSIFITLKIKTLQTAFQKDNFQRAKG